MPTAGDAGCRTGAGRLVRDLRLRHSAELDCDIIVTGARETYTAPETGAATRTDTPLIQVPQSVQVLTKTLI
jgi:outer membrane receptor protein involved in Fe transport